MKNISSTSIKLNNSIGKKIRKNIPLYILLLPSAILLFCFSYIPMYGLIIAFKDYSPSLGIMNSPWVGLRNFTQFFNSYQFATTLKNTLVISIYGMLVGFPLPIGLALMCNQIRHKAFKKVFQVTTYLPHFISTMVMCGLILIFLSPSSGLIANIFKLIGIDMPNLMSSITAFKHVYVWSDIWQHLGWDSIIYLAALSSIDPTFYEAATIDGASTLQKIRNIDMPLILPTAMILLVLRAGSILGVGFEKVFLLQNTQNIMASEIISTYVYKVGMQSFQYSLSTAIGLFNTVVNLIVLLAINWVAKKTTETSLL
ncbi:MAG: ABC transporter permease subunit [Clostridium butyricum]|jgi:putative aldouronate transport system permease protein|nr:ABC transporter permease subunit [Clostridium butyricum]